VDPSAEPPSPRVVHSGLTDSEATAVVDAAVRVTGMSWTAHETPLAFHAHAAEPGFGAAFAADGTAHRVAALVGLADDGAFDIAEDIVATLDDAGSAAAAEPFLVAPAPAGSEDADAVGAARAQHAAHWDLAAAAAANPESAWTSDAATLVRHVALDGAATENNGWDNSVVAVYDGVVDEALRAALQALIGVTESTAVPTSEAKGPDPATWERGGFTDVPQADGAAPAGTWGLRAEALERLCADGSDGDETPAAVVELQTRVAALLRAANPAAADGLAVCRMPAAALGDSVTPLAANAPVHADGEDAYGWHIDADPMLLPPSPWTDYHGRYRNRRAGKPRFVTALVYLPDEWRWQWGAPTRFLDTPTDEVLEIEPAPGRVVLMDQDLTHAVAPPAEAAGPRARYSLVLKLVVDGGAANLASTEPTPFGSAKRQPLPTKPQAAPRGPAPVLSGADKRVLRTAAGRQAQAKTLTYVQVAGASKSAKAADGALEANELVRCKFVVKKKSEAKAMAAELAEKTGAAVVQVLGKTADLYRPARVPRMRLDVGGGVAGQQRGDRE